MGEIFLTLESNISGSGVLRHGKPKPTSGFLRSLSSFNLTQLDVSNNAILSINS